jgi:hypothetical protein
MDTLHIGGREWRVKIPHPVITAGVAEAYTAIPADRATLRTAFLGLCLQGAPLRFAGETWTTHGMRVYDWLLSQGWTHYEILTTAGRVLVEAMDELPDVVTEADVDLGEARSTQTAASSTPGSASPASGPATPSGG